MAISPYLVKRDSWLDMRRGIYFSCANFFLSVVGVLISLHVISQSDWALLGILLATYPLTSSIVFFQGQQQILVDLRDSASCFVLGVFFKLLPLLFFSVPLLLGFYYFVISDDIYIVLSSVLFSVALGMRIIQKYALTLQANSELLFKSNCISLVVWVFLLVLLHLSGHVSSAERVLTNLIGELVAFLYVLRSVNQEPLKKSVGLSFNMSFNFIRLLIRQFNYNFPVYIVGWLLSLDYQSQIGQMSRVRAVVDQVANTFVVTFSKNIMRVSPLILLFASFLLAFPAAIVILMGFWCLSWFSEILFSGTLLSWFSFCICLWVCFIPAVLWLESRQRIYSLVFMEIFYFVAIVLSFCFGFML